MTWGAIGGAAVGVVGSYLTKDNQGGFSEQKSIDPRIAQYLYGTGGLLGGVHNLQAKQTGQGGLNPMQNAGLEMQRQTLMSPEYSRGFDQMRTLGGNLMGGGVAGNPFAGGYTGGANLGMAPRASGMPSGFAGPMMNSTTAPAFSQLMQGSAAPEVGTPTTADPGIPPWLLQLMNQAPARDGGPGVGSPGDASGGDAGGIGAGGDGGDGGAYADGGAVKVPKFDAQGNLIPGQYGPRGVASAMTPEDVASAVKQKKLDDAAKLVKPTGVPLKDDESLNVPGSGPMRLQKQMKDLGLMDGGRANYIKGGEVDGPGTARSDSIPARLSNGEYVVDAATVKKIGKGDTQKGQDLLDKWRKLL